MTGQFKMFVQSVARRAGYQIRRLEPGVQMEDPYQEQRRLAGDARMIFEVGAADGRDCDLYRILFPEAQVHAFEPVPESFDQVAARAARDPAIHAHRKALSDTVGTATFHLSNWLDSSSLLKPQSTGSTFDVYQASSRAIEVETDTLDRVCAAEGVTRIDVLKIDAQGAELAILRGAAGMLGRGAIRVIYTEAQFRPSYEGAGRFDQIMTYLVDAGFELQNLFNLNHNQRGELCWCDALFVLKETEPRG